MVQGGRGSRLILDRCRPTTGTAATTGFPTILNTQVFFYNKADFAAANLFHPPPGNETISDAKLLTIPSKGQHGLGVDSTDIWNVGPLRVD